jgi:diguanylate cyclase (GGDEF)-like protein
MADRFPCGLLVSDISSRKLSFANHYVAEMLGYTSEEMANESLNKFLSKASLIFLDSYVYPALLTEGEHTELQLTLVSRAAERIPVLANIRANDQGFLHWALFSAVERDKMYQELIAARDQLQRRAAELKALAASDPLTGLLNRRAAEQLFVDLFQQSLRTENPISALLLDIDHFKQINDRYGHLEGDRILIEIAELIQSTLRQVDIGARWGGEEFLILLHNTDITGAVELAKRIHQGLQAVKLEGFPVRASIGAASVSLIQEPASDAMDRVVLAADQALYQAKEFGRNRTVVAQS